MQKINQAPKDSSVLLMAQMAFLTAIMLVMAFTPLGYIPLPFTTLVIPKIPPRAPPALGPNRQAPMITGMCMVVAFIKGRGI